MRTIIIIIINRTVVQPYVNGPIARFMNPMCKINKYIVMNILLNHSSAMTVQLSLIATVFRIVGCFIEPLIS